MKIKELIKQDAGFQYIIDSLELMSSAGRRVLLNSAFCTDAAELEHEWDNLQEAIRATGDTETRRQYTDLRHCLMQLHDLQGTLASLAARTPLNEVELFEVKNLSLLTRQARRATAALGLAGTLPLPDLDEVFALLDPDSTGMANFYIYDSYDNRLPALRRELKALQEHDGDPSRIAALLSEQSEIQSRVCTELSDRLLPRTADLTEALNRLAYADSLLARAELAIRWHLTRPTLGDTTSYRSLWNPRLRHRNEELGMRYQPVDISLEPGVCLVTGANMAGKTVLLKSLGSAQLMAQCGMFVPAEEATVRLAEGIMTSIGDEQDEMNGLSSYASEITKISNIIGTCRERNMLVLIDEPARTTNPVEGKALVQAIIGLLQQCGSTTLITTHYSQLGSNCRRLRVRGFVEDLADVPLTPQSINRFIDYSLTEDQSDNVPHEALRIASILGCDEQLIRLAQENINH